jgi:hypothetical protein
MSFMSCASSACSRLFSAQAGTLDIKNRIAVNAHKNRRIFLFSFCKYNAFLCGLSGVESLPQKSSRLMQKPLPVARTFDGRSGRRNEVEAVRSCKVLSRAAGNADDGETGSVAKGVRGNGRDA